MNWIYILDDQIVFGNAFSLRYDIFIKLMTFTLIGSFLLGMFLINKTFFFMLVLFTLGAVSIIPMRLSNGAIGTDLIFFLTVYASSQLGFIYGFILSKLLNIALILIVGEFELSFLYDLGGLTIVAFISSLIPDISQLGIAALIMLVVYHIGYNIFNRAAGSDSGQSYLWSGTHLMINFFLISQLMPFLPSI
jgi:hypothetical protein